jgi:peptidoglycan/xylan/chitin deacetylase (PgdA/CDA1 family)
MSIAKKLNLTTVLWNVFPRDYSSTSNQIIKRVLRNTKSGSLICLHDGPANRNETVKALPVIISELRNKGFEFVSLDELNK